jgi:hypothetical protein
MNNKFSKIFYKLNKLHFGHSFNQNISNLKRIFYMILPKLYLGYYFNQNILSL